MRIETAATLFVVVIVVSSVSFAVPVGSSSAVHDRPIGALSSDTGPADQVSTVDPTPAASDPATLSGFSAVHAAGVTGDDVRVGIVGSQFAADNSRISDAVAATRRFAGRPSGLFADTSHDTAVAEIVSRTAPDAELYLASIGPDGGPETYAEAVSWLREQEVDVVVDAGSYFPSSADGMAKLNRVASAAAQNDTAFVTSAGNYADRHWHGTGSEGWLAFENGTRYNTLGNGEIGGAVSLRLYWQGDVDYDLYLYRAVDGEDPLVAKSAANATGQTEAIDATVPTGEYYVAIRGGPDANDTSVDLFASHHELGVSSDSGGMVAPATAEDVIAVGAADAVSGQRRPYSSAGPALDISAPDGADTSAAGELYGSSAAAPLVAGTLTLMLAENESLTPSEAQRVLRDTAVSHDGELYLDAAGAVQAVSTTGRAFDDPALDWYNETVSEGGR